MYKSFFKRTIDIVLSLTGLILLSWLFLIIIIAIKIDSRGPVFFKQKRVGKNKKHFYIHKFRTMYIDTPKDMPTHMLNNPEKFITKVGKFLRKTSLDELPQFLDVFTGNMSVVGPRPALWNQYDLIEERDKYGANNIRPGITGWAQINGRDELEIPVKAKLDGEYVKKLSFLFDIKIFFLTFIKVFKSEGVVEGQTQSINTNKKTKKQKIKTSVLMSVYKNDDPNYLKLALESIYEKQTKKPDEIVVVFDGELTKDLYQILNDFKKDKKNIVRYYPQKKNKGLGEALRIGSEKCTGDYIFRMDSDDISDSLRFEKQISYIEQNPEIDVLGTDIAEFNTSLDEKMRYRVCPEKHEEIVKMSKRRNPMNHVTVCIKKEALKKCGGYETLLLLEDYYLWLKMIANNCKLANIHESLVYVRVGNGFNEKRKSKIRIKGWKTLQSYMLKNKMINVFEAFTNMVYIYGFIYCPSFIRKIAYNKILRKQS